MTITEQAYIGIDIAKDKFDVAVLGQKLVTQVVNNKKEIARFTKQMQELDPQLIVVEATGGYEEAVLLELYAAGLPVALVSPQQIGRASCRERV